MFDYFVLFYTITGGAVLLSLSVFALVVFLTSRDPHPPLPKRSARFSDRSANILSGGEEAEAEPEPLQEKIAT